MEKLELYHFHKEGTYDKLWKENSTILVPNNFKSATFKRVTNFTNNIEMPNEQNINYYDLVAQYVSAGNFDMKSVMHMLKLAYEISFYSNEFKRETALENYRLATTPNLPSRLHSVYLTDEKGIEAWKNKFGNAKLTLYRVEAEGNIFKTNEQLIPVETLSYQEVYDSSYLYWHPNFKKVPEDANEYLTQGKIKVLEKIPFN